MERIPSGLPTVRLVDIDKEILKGKTVKPGLLNDDATPGPSKIANNENISFLPETQSSVTNTYILSQGMPALAPIGSPAMTTYIVNTAVGSVAQRLVTRTENQMKCVIAKEQPAASIQQPKNVPPILRRAPQLVTQTVPVEKMWSEIKNGVRFVHPSNLDHDVLNKVMDTLKTKKSLKNTIISLPNSVYLVPLSCFKGAPLPVDSMVSIASDENGEKGEEEADEVITKLKHPCWSNKRHRKLDMDGFSAYDRLGFYKSDSQRSKKCQKNVDSIIENLRNSIVKIQEELLYLDSVEQKKKRKLQKRKAEQSEQNNKRRRRKKKLLAEPSSVSPKTSFETMTTEQLALIDRGSFHVIDHLNFESYVHHRLSLFVSNDCVVTEMILNLFPNFREAVDNGVVKIATEADFISVFGVESVKHERQVEEDLNKHLKFVKFLKDNNQLLNVLSDHSYAVNENRNF